MIVALFVSERRRKKLPLLAHLRRKCRSHRHPFRMSSRGRSLHSFLPNALSALFAFEKAYGLALVGIEKLMRELQGGGASRTVKEPVLRLGGILWAVDHHRPPNLQ